MKKFYVVFAMFIAVSMIFIFSDQGFAAGEKATKDECVAKVKEAVKLIKEIGFDAASKKISDRNGPFVWKDSYVFCTDNDQAKMLVHPHYPFVVGTNMLNWKDEDGRKLYVDILKIAAEKGKGWKSYNYLKPGASKPLMKTTYFELESKSKKIVYAGYYQKSHSDEAQYQDYPVASTLSDRWVSSTMKNSLDSLRISVHDGDSCTFITDGHRDHKPVWSKEGDRIAFFRATGDWETIFKPFHLYRTHICIVNSDGTGFKKLTDATNPDVNPTWTRDGSNKIIFSRLAKSQFGNSRVFMISPDAASNDTLLVSDPDHFAWAESGLKDGRIFIFEINKVNYVLNYISPFTWPNTQSYYLLDPESKKQYPVRRPNKFPTHKLSLSPTESKVVYMKDLDGKIHTYNDAVIAYAEFDLENLEVKNEVVISAEDKNHTDMYPRWSQDERYIIYSSSRGRTGHTWGMRQYMYDLQTGKTHLISNDTLVVDMYPCFEDLPK